jgi:hypothetical protein
MFWMHYDVPENRIPWTRPVVTVNEADAVNKEQEKRESLNVGSLDSSVSRVVDYGLKGRGSNPGRDK